MTLKESIKYSILKSPAARIWLRSKRETLTILCVHGVTQSNRLGKTANYSGRDIHKDVFAETIEYLLEYFNPVSIGQIDDYYYRSKSLPENPILLTFDDGFENNYTNALPVLKRCGCPAIVFLATGYLDNKALFWWERLEYAFHNTQKKRLQATVFGNGFDFPIHTNPEKEIAFKAVGRFLKSGLIHSRIEEAACLISDLLGFPDLKTIDENEDYRFLTWEEAREMAGSGISFGAHTVNHINLAIEDIETAEWEIRASKDEIERQLGGECIAFCYPLGRSGYNNTVEDLLKKAGLKFSFQLGGELNDRNTNPLLLNRIPLGWETKKEDLLWHILRK